jgi:hypothetical protein
MVLMGFPDPRDYQYWQGKGVNIYTNSSSITKQDAWKAERS